MHIPEKVAILLRSIPYQSTLKWIEPGPVEP